MDWKELHKMRARLVSNGGWNCDEFEEMEQDFENDPDKYKPILEVLLNDINFYGDEYHWNFHYTLEHVIPHTGGKKFLRVLIRMLMPKGQNQESITEYFQEFFHPYSDGGEPICTLSYLTDILKEGLQSKDQDYRMLTETFLSQIFDLLQYLQKEPPYKGYDPYIDDYIESILYMFVWLYKKFYTDTNRIDQAVSVLPDKYQKYFYEQKKLLDDFRKEHPGISF